MQVIKKLIPIKAKEYIKSKIMCRLDLVPSRDFRIVDKVVSQGIDNYLTLDYEKLRISTLEYIKSMHIDGYEYRYAESCNRSTLYASVYACMLYGLYGELDYFSDNEKRNWADYFDSFQCVDGYFRDPNLAGEEFEGDVQWGDGWGIRHLAAHIIIAYARLGYTPKYRFKFLEPYYDEEYLKEWLNNFDFGSKVWSISNYIMNLCTLLQYARDYMNENQADKSIKIILDWLVNKQNKETGMWHEYNIDDYFKLSDAIRGAYHFYPLFVYEGQEIKYTSNVVKYILKSQNSWGAFEEKNKPSGACEDIDAIEPLIRFTINSKNEETIFSVKKALFWILANKNSDGGFVFMLETPNNYGGHPLTSSLINESNMFATWFRTLTLAYIFDYLEIPNKFNIGKFPGYEITLREYK